MKRFVCAFRYLPLLLLFLSNSLYSQQEPVKKSDLQLLPGLPSAPSYGARLATFLDPAAPKDYPIHVIVKFRDDIPVRGASIGSMKGQAKLGLNLKPYPPVDVSVGKRKFSDSHKMIFVPGFLPEIRIQKSAKAKSQLFTQLSTSKFKTTTAQLQDVNRLFDSPGVIHVRSFIQANVSLFRSTRNNNWKLPDLENFYIVSFGQDDASYESFIRELETHAIVEEVYVAPFPQNADIPPTTQDLEPSQGHLDEIEVEAAWSLGANGEGVTIADIEFAWNLDHEDLDEPAFADLGAYEDIRTDWRTWIVEGILEEYVGPVLETRLDPDNWRSHGTSVLGVAVARDDGAGVTGIAHGADFAVVTVARRWTPGTVSNLITTTGLGFYSVADAIVSALEPERLKAGDIILIEQHAPDIFGIDRALNDGTSCPCSDNSCSQFRYLPMEFWGMEFAAIQHATAMGITVVEAAGNGSQDLDHENFEGRFERESGAILVGAGNPTSRTPRCTSNFGSAVDLHGWGAGVVTLGGKTLAGGVVDDDVTRVNGSDRRQWYDRDFGGTSAAAPIVAGVAAILQGLNLERGDLAIPAAEMRTLLVETGTAQATDDRNIGPLPNLGTAVPLLLSTPSPEPEVGIPCTSPMDRDTCGRNECRAFTSVDEDNFTVVEECTFFIFCDTVIIHELNVEYMCVAAESD